MRRPLLVVGLAALVVLAGCGGSDSSSSSKASSSRSSSKSSSATSSTVDRATTSSTSPAAAITNTWVGPPVDPTKLPIGTASVSTTGASRGGLFACDGGNPNGGGAFRAGPWIDEAAGTWNAEAKVVVEGKVSWPMAKYLEFAVGGVRTITSNGLPVGDVTGTFPIAASDPAYAYDRNPNSIAATDITKTLPVTPTAASTPGCLGKGAIGILRNGVVLYAPIDERNRDAVAYETQDECDGHPQQTSNYHYHDVASCALVAAIGSSTVVGFAYDGYPIVVERDASGALPTNADLDECHGRTSPIVLDGKVTTTYHYSATAEFPYTIGCFHGSTVGEV